MSDVLSKKQRSYCMSRIKGRDTKPEIALRKALWKRGFRYRTRSKLPGRPDLVFAGRRVVVFVDGCFWHRCPDHFVAPRANAEFWREKVAANVERDGKVDSALRLLGWRVLRVWEHEVRADTVRLAMRLARVIGR